MLLPSPPPTLHQRSKRGKQAARARHSKASAAILKPVAKCWLRAGSRIVCLVAFLAMFAYRVGEASNPGPFQHGGASSSHDAAPAVLDIVDGALLATTKGNSLQGFDDPEGFAYEEEEVDVASPYYEPPDAGGDLIDRSVYQSAAEQLDSEIQLELRRGPPRWPSAMVAWEVSPALVEGLIELPCIEEEQKYGFETKEGWWVSDPLARQATAAAHARAARLEISHLKGRSAGEVAQKRAVGSVMPLECDNECARLATFQCADLPALPVIEEQLRESREVSVNSPVQPQAPQARKVSETSSSRRRKRGRRRRGKAHEREDMVSVWSFNTSGAPQLRAAVGHGSALGADCPIAILCQEHHAGPDQLCDLQAQLKSAGWSLAAARAEVTPLGGRSAGVGICTPTHVMAGIDEGRSVDRSPKGQPGRTAAAWIHQIAPGGVMVLSCYLHDSEQGTARNLELLVHALQDARESGCPWIIGLDAQQPPTELLKWAAPAVDRADGVIAAPSAPTHFPGVGCSRTLDYFIISRALAGAVVSIDTLSELRYHSREAEVVVAAKPHRVARLWLRREFQPALLATLRTPKAFPRAKPIGCPRRPVVPKERSAQWAFARDAKLREAGASEAWGSIVAAIEDELCGICDNFDKKYKGRHEDTEVVLRPALPRRAAGPRGAMAQSEFAVVWAMNRLREMAALSDLHARGGVLTGGQWSQWDHLLRKMCSPSAPIASEEGRWSSLVEQLQCHRRQPSALASTLGILFNWSVALVTRQEKCRTEQRRRSWQEWLRAQVAAGAGGGALFNFIKRTEADPEIIVRCNGVRSASPQAVLDNDFMVWNGLWSKLAHLGTTPWREQGVHAEEGLDLPNLGHEALRTAAKSFRPRTGMGVDALVPTQFAWLSDELLDAVGEFFMALEKAGCWPGQVSLAMAHLIPKATGGRRPIGLLAFVVRLWERARKPVVEGWRDTCARRYDWMAKGKGAERSVWAQALYEEAAVAERRSTASVLFDLVKAFEQVVLGRVWECGLKHSMPRPMLVLALEACTFSRRLTYRKAVSQAANTTTAILAGSGRATDLLLVTLIDAVDGVLLWHERNSPRTVLRAFMIVDDIHFAAEGEELDVATILPKVAGEAVRMLEHELHMQVSRDYGGVKGKTVAQASSVRLGAGMQMQLNRLGIRVVKKVKNLGVQFVAGGKRSFTNQVTRDRYKEGLRRLQRASTAGKAARRKAAQSLFVPSFTFGACAVACPAALVSDLRKHAANAFGNMGGRSVSVRLLLEGADVGEKIAIKTVMAWVCGLWDELVEAEVMHKAWRHACVANMEATSCLRGTLSGAVAYFATLRRLGWLAPSANSVRTRNGTLLYFGPGAVPAGGHMADPTLVRRFVVDDYEEVAISQSTLARDMADLSGRRGYPGEVRSAKSVLREMDQGYHTDSSTLDSSATEDEAKAAALWRRGRFVHLDDGPVPWLWPVRAVIKAARRAGLTNIASSVRSLAEGGWPTQFRLRVIGHAEHARCLCGEIAGTLRHKLGFCPLAKEVREEHCPEWITHCCSKEGWNPLFSRGVPAKPLAAKLPTDRSWLEADAAHGHGIASGDVYTDGSSTGSYWLARRGGWSVVSLSASGRWQWTRYGTLGGPNISSYRAELRALLEALRCAVPPLRIHTDNQPVLDGLACGRSWCVSSRAAEADLWREVWVLLESKRRLGEVSVVKVRAHTGWHELLERVISPKDQYGNWLADAAAKAGARQAEVEAPAAAFRAQAAKALTWLKWVARYAAHWVKDTAALEGTLARRPCRAEVQKPEFDFGDTHLSHEVWAIGGSMVCRRCGVGRQFPGGHAVILPRKCEGTAAGRAAARTTGNINYMWTQFALTRAELMVRGGRLLSAKGPPKWLVDPGRLPEAAETPERLAALTRYLHTASGADEEVQMLAAVPPWLQAPSWMPAPLVQPWEKEEEALRRLQGCVRVDLGPRLTGHKLAFAGPVAYCTRCACFALERLGCRFKGKCELPSGRALSAVSYRLARLRAGKHPITGKALDTGADAS